MPSTSKKLLNCLLPRAAYHKAIKMEKNNLFRKQAEDLINRARVSGIKALYKSAKKFSPRVFIHINVFRDYCLKLYSSSEPPSLFRIPSCLPKSSPLLDPIDAVSLKLAVLKQKSKAKSNSGLSPSMIKEIFQIVFPKLLPVFNSCLSSVFFPLKWLEAKVFFICKANSRTDPKNYRSISIQNPFLKIFQTILAKRLTEWAERNGLLPECQFGFRPKKPPLPLSQ